MGDTRRPRPKSPPEYPDMCGQLRLQFAVQALDKEIHFLQEELHSLERIGPASKCCKEVVEFVVTNPDQLIKTYEKRNKSCCIWKILRAILCCNLASICCSNPCSLKTPKCRCAKLKDTSCCHNSHVNCTSCNCCKLNWCNLDPSVCPDCSCSCICSCSACVETCFCPSRTGCCCTGSCCIGRCIW